MKKNAILFAFMALFCFNTKAQAPDFTATDINGNTWHLYELLDAGKTVILDFSATWCSPCWQYHHEGVLENLYATFGPEGSDQLMVFFVESDYSTTAADLNGTGGNTQGDWVTGTNYPIIDQSGVEDLFSIPGYPTLYTICPDKSMEQTNRRSFDEYVEVLMTQCPNSIAGNLDVIATPLIGDLSYNQACNSITPKIDILNIGSTNVTSAVVQLKINGQLVETKNSSGLLQPLDRGAVYFGTHNVNQGDLVEITITQVNGSNDDVQGNNTWSFTTEPITATAIPSNQLTFELMTDTTPNESSWEFTAANGTLIASGDSYSLSSNLYSETITLPSDGCYKFSFYDSFGDGLYPIGAYYRLSCGSLVLAEGVEFEYLEEYLFNFEVQSGGSATIHEATEKTYSISPNPTKDKIEIELTENHEFSNYFITDAFGKLISHSNFSGKNMTIDLSDNKPGIYFLTLSNGATLKTEKIILY